MRFWIATPALFAALALSSVATPALADDIVFQYDNDKYISDRHYTAGLRAAYTPRCQTGASLTLGKAVSKANILGDINVFGFEGTPRVGAATGFAIYTPDNTEFDTPKFRALRAKDRPYAGWMYGAATFTRANANSFGRDTDTYDEMEFSLGIVGPRAQGHYIQNRVHDFINVARAYGWENQIDNTLAANIFRQRKIRLATQQLYGGTQFDTVIHGVGSLGNVRTDIGGGVTVRFGTGLGQNFGPSYRQFAVPTKAPSKNVFYAFLGGETRYVMRDMFLDGPIFGSGPHIRRKPLVAEGRIGVASHLLWPQDWLGSKYFKAGRLELARVRRTSEFYGQDRDDHYISLVFGLSAEF